MPLIAETELVALFDHLWQHPHLHDNHFQFINTKLLPAKWNDETLDHTITNNMIRALVLPWCVDSATRMQPSYLKGAKDEFILGNFLKNLLNYKCHEQVYFILCELTQDPTHGQALLDLILEVSKTRFNSPTYLYTFVGQADVSTIKPFIDKLIARQNWDEFKPFLMHATKELNRQLIEYILQHPQLNKLAESIKATSQPYNEVLNNIPLAFHFPVFQAA